MEVNHCSEENVISVFRVGAVLLHADFLLGLLSDPKDEGDMFLRNVGLSPKLTALKPRILYSS